MVRVLLRKTAGKFDGDILKKYLFTKEVFLDEKLTEEKSIIEKIERILFENNIEKNNIEDIIDHNQVFQFDSDCDFNVRKIEYWWEENQIRLTNCEILFLLKKENEFSNFLKEFTNEIKIDNINVEFPKSKRTNDEHLTCKGVIQEILEGKSFTKIIDRVELEKFFEGRKIACSKEISLDEIRKLKNVHADGFLIMFVSAKELPANDISKILNDIKFYIGDNNKKELLYSIKIDENYKESKLKIIAGYRETE